jgi:hypothetical protein
MLSTRVSLDGQSIVNRGLCSLTDVPIQVDCGTEENGPRLER